MHEDADIVRAPRWQPRMVLALVAACAVAVLAAGFVLVQNLVADERARDLRGWQVRLGIVADSRTAAVADWLERQLDAVGGIAQSASVQLYMTELALARGDRAGVSEEAAQAGYLRNLLLVTADRTGFAGPPSGPAVPANIPRRGGAGLAIVDRGGRIVLATPDMPALDERLVRFAVDAAQGKRVLDLAPGTGGQPIMAFFAPIIGVQADPGSERVGGVLGIKAVGQELYPLLARPPSTDNTAESLLVRRAGPVIDYLSPRLDATPPFERSLAVDTPALAEAFAIANPGGFAVRRDYRDKEVLVTGRALTTVPWTLVHKIDRAEALMDSDARLDRLLALLVMAVALVTAAFIAVWRHGASRRATAAAERLQVLSRGLQTQAALLRVITDSQPAAIFIADGEDRLRFANKRIADQVEVPAADLVGKTLASVFGPAASGRYSRLNREARERRTIQPAIYQEADGRILRAEHIPLSESGKGQVLVVEEDITAPIVERERRERTLRELVRTLVALLDRRDPFAADHSQRVATVARRIAEEMGLDSVTIETAEIAGTLLNIGKILVPSQILTRSSVLSEEERQKVRESLQAGADLLAAIEFDGPVVETLRQAQEHWDGSGPLSLRGEAIQLTARIIAVANAFVAMLSPRAHRAGIEIDAAIASLNEEAGRAFDRRVVAALVNDIENRGGRARWASLAPSP